MNYEDKDLECKECQKKFIWTASEQDFFAKKGFENIPARCPECRIKARERRQETQAAFKVKCSKCNKEGDVPFEPNEKPVYCEECFKKIKEN